ncbi:MULTISPECIES: hypothetical protein [Bacillus]|nr:MULTISPECIES: hypothetical protein [Bacillus]EJT20215.1 hypothetical protein B353_14146 [Bacillus anthracis str. UR-1]AAT57265.1 hypothetical protein BAS4975 [Bacillus anthracis str. Sterne]ACP17033.1 hypothetical protein BAMEG_5408 [Bacillus anthracis str. CDC 684]ACQ48292.1 hypothetical protein BAA_5385 [Bacillus anthracis str. A0248]AFH86491.1 Hypothetical Protein H9401_5105 [Bacillus anthracis str. H9401]
MLGKQRTEGWSETKIFIPFISNLRKELINMGNAVKSVAQVKQKMSKDTREARIEAEKQVVTNIKTKPKAYPFVSKPMKRIFNKLIKLNENFTESDSMSLSMLTKSLYRYELLNTELEELEIFDELSVDLEKRIHAYERSIIAHMKDLCIPLSQRLRLSNDIAKLMIEEKKLEQMNQQNNQAINPLMALLEEDDDE